MTKEVTCIMCPLGCSIEVQIDGHEVSVKEGSRCKKGIKFAKMEAIFPGRILTTTMRTDTPGIPLLPVRSNKEIPKDQLMACMAVISKHPVRGRAKMGQQIITDILGLGVDIVACRTIP